MLKNFPITTELQRYGDFYRQAGIKEKDIPPYRLTCQEHKRLLDEFTIIFGERKKDMIKSYMGIYIEVVMIVEPYC